MLLDVREKPSPKLNVASFLLKVFPVELVRRKAAIPVFCTELLINVLCLVDPSLIP